MSIPTGENMRTGRASCNGIVRRMVNLPRSVIGGVSRVMGHGINLMGGIGRREQEHPQRINAYWAQPQEPQIPEEMVFLASFEHQYGFSHPFFYASRFIEALKIAEEEHKLVFMYLHSPEHPFTSSFCINTLCSDLVVQFLDANFVSWGGLGNRGEGLHMVSTLQVPSFPFCAVVAPASGNSIAVLQQLEGPVSPGELVEILQKTMEEQGLAFGISKVKEEEKRKMDRKIREEQDAAYLAALKLDMEKERTGQIPVGKKVEKPASKEMLKQNSTSKQQPGKMKEIHGDNQYKEISNNGKDPPVTQILIRFPNGERREKSFLCTEKIQSIYRYIDSLNLSGIGSYRLISSFPRKVYGYEQIGMTLKDAGLHPKATLFLELL